jgi:hypothetical protein
MYRTQISLTLLTLCISLLVSGVVPKQVITKYGPTVNSKFSKRFLGVLQTTNYTIEKGTTRNFDSNLAG